MPQAARLNDSVAGMTAGEHSGHVLTPHPPVSFTGNITSGCSPNVFINGRAAATKGSITTEYDSCCGSSNGSVAGGSTSVFINGKAAARKGDALNAHSGSGSITSGSENVFIGG